MPQTERKGWIDIARALAMIFVIFGHVGNETVAAGVSADAVYGGIATVINPLKLPLFFAISGYLFSAKNDDPAFFFKKMLRTRLIPYAVWGSFMGIVAFGMDMYRCGFQTSRIGSLLVSNYLVPFVRGNLIWFIPCLIVLEILFFAMQKLARHNLVALTAITLVCTALGYWWSAGGVVKPWKLDTALTCTQFMTLGYLIRHVVEEKTAAISMKKQAVLCLGVYAVALCLLQFVWPGCTVDINRGRYFNPIVFSLLSWVGVYAVFCVTKLCREMRPLLFVGRNTFIYFVWHMYAAKLVLTVGLKLPFAGALPMTLLVLIVTAVVCVLVAVVCLFVNRFLPFTVGHRAAPRGKSAGA